MAPGEAMTRAQQIALAHPCYLAGETMHLRFGPRLVGRNGVSVKLTVNAGYE
jgi:hypothetical protein